MQQTKVKLSEIEKCFNSKLQITCKICRLFYANIIAFPNNQTDKLVLATLLKFSCFIKSSG